MSLPQHTLKHTISDEKAYIDRIGLTHRATRRIPRKQVLMSYIEACKNRVNWNGMDAEEVKKYANEQLATL